MKPTEVISIKFEYARFSKRGTAFMIAPGKIVTALHLLKRDWKKVSIAFWNEAKSEYAKKTASRCEITNCWQFKEYDIAILESELPGSRPAQVCREQYSGVRICEVYGFPQLDENIDPDHPHGFKVDNFPVQCPTPIDGEAFQKLNSDCLPQKTEDAQGLSGAPVWDAQYGVIGIVVKLNAKSYDKKTLKYVSIYQLLQNEEFRKALEQLTGDAVPEPSGPGVTIQSLRNLLKRAPDKGDLDRLWKCVRKDDIVTMVDQTEETFDKLNEEQKLELLLARLLSENDISVDGHLQKIEVLVAETTQRGPNGKLADRSHPSCQWFCSVLWHCVAIRIQQDMVAPLLSKIANKETRLRGVSVPSVAEVVVLTAMSNLYRSGRDGGPLLPSFSQRRTIEIDGQQHCIGDGAIPLDDLPLDGKHATLQYVLHVVERGVQMPRPIRPDQNLEGGQLERNLGQLRTHLKQKIGGLKPKAYYGILPLREPSSGPDNHSETISQFERFCAELGGYFQLVQLGDRYDMTEREIQLDFLIQQHFSLETE